MIYDSYTIFTPGPVAMSKDILEIGAQQTPYFRNQEFSNILLQCEQDLLELLNAPKNSRVVFLTASGTAGLESVVMNLLGDNDKSIVINGGGFGERFVSLCESYNKPHTQYKVKNTNLSDIETICNPTGHNSFIINAHETSIGTLYDLDAIGKYTKKHNLLNIVDAISMFVTDELDMQKHNIDTVILSSQKGLALPPGLTMVVLNPKAIKRIQNIQSHYFNFKNYLTDGLRGQTPYTPCVTIILQLKARLDQIKKDGGIKSTISKANQLATYFRKQIINMNLDYKFFTPYMPNAMTTLQPTTKTATQVVQQLEQQYKIVVCPNGGELKDTIFRVSHMGNLTIQDIDSLLMALKEI